MVLLEPITEPTLLLISSIWGLGITRLRYNWLLRMVGYNSCRAKLKLRVMAFSKANDNRSDAKCCNMIDSHTWHWHFRSLLTVSVITILGRTSQPVTSSEVQTMPRSTYDEFTNFHVICTSTYERPRSTKKMQKLWVNTVCTKTMPTCQRTSAHVCCRVEWLNTNSV